MADRRWLRGVLAVAGTYVYFLLFAQFAFLDRLQAALDRRGVETAMAAMGLAGIASSLAAAAWPRRRRLPAAFVAAAAVAVAALAARGSAALHLIAAATGVVTAIVTVDLAASLRERLGKRLGLGVGLGTGAAYLVANVPAVFAGSVALRVAVAAGAALLAAVAAAGEDAPPHRGDGEPVGDATPIGLVGVTLALLALVALDSAAFATVQEHTALRDATWGEGARTLGQGLWHLVGAAAAGALLDRGRFTALLLATAALFAAGFAGLAHGHPSAGPLYALGISVYSTALVAYPSRGGDGPGQVPARWRAGVVFGVAGWIGSALGVGLAQRLDDVPAWAVVAAGALVTAGVLLARRPAPAATLPLLSLAVAAAVYGLDLEGPAGGAATEAVARGRAVYVAEGCVGCHSQYVRPRVAADLELYGPHRPLDRGARPPLVGSRRLGPDLSNAARRHDADWQRRHLQDPRALSPGSTMPSYAHLFADRRGEDLVAYLESLGAGAP